MTEQEAEALAERLRRVWMPEGDTEWSVVSFSIFQFRAFLAPNARLNLNCNNPVVGRDQYFLSLQKAESLKQAQSGIILVCYECGFGVGGDSQFASEWLPFFRRGCWLSGCAIDASAHEKAEWIQEVTREEIEAWNLNF